MQLHHEFIHSSTCSYLPGLTSTMEYKIISDMSMATYAKYLEKGYRRFGLLYFRPKCIGCHECIPYRILVDEFRPRKDMKRCFKRNSEISHKVDIPNISAEKVELYNRYHAFQEGNVGWREQKTTPQEYFETFAIPCETAREFCYYDKDKLIGVGYVDEVDNAISSIYFIHDPEYRQAGLGMFSVLTEIEWAKQRKKDYVYLGYFIRDCKSMNYKGRYRPCEVLTKIPQDSDEPQWTRWE